MKKRLWISALAAALTIAGCGSAGATEPKGDDVEITTARKITVVSREEGSGTRSAFEELIGIDEEHPLVSGVNVSNGNGPVANTVKDNEDAIGYISFVTLDEVKGIRGIKVDGVEPTVEKVLAGEYPLSRPFVLIYDENAITDADRAFIAFLESEDGLDELEAHGAIIDRSQAEPFDATAYGQLEGVLKLGGSTSTEAVVQAAADAFKAVFPHVEYTYDATGSGAGIKNAQDGTYSIGFASKEVADDELADGVVKDTFCKDGIAVAVNEGNELEGVTKEQLFKVYTGEITTWEELK